MTRSGHAFAGCAAVLWLACSLGLAQEQEGEATDEGGVSWGAETDVNSQYVWRGIIFDKHLVVQPTAWLSAKNLTFSLWNNHVPQAENGFASGNEFDFELAYEKNLGAVNMELSTAYYVYPHQKDSPPTGEAAMKLAVPKGPFELSTTQTFDVVQYPGAYFGEVQAAVHQDLIRGLNGEISASAGWASAKFNETYVGLRRTALNFVSGQAAVTFPFTSHVYLKPHAELFHAIDSAVAEATQREAWNFGGTLGIEW